MASLAMGASWFSVVRFTEGGLASQTFPNTRSLPKCLYSGAHHPIDNHKIVSTVEVLRSTLRALNAIPASIEVPGN